MGFASNMVALNSFSGACFSQLRPVVGAASSGNNHNNNNTFGGAFVCLVLATVFKLVDVAAHLVVPVPKVDYWRGRGSESNSNRSNSNKNTDDVIIQSETENAIHLEMSKI